MSLSARVTFFGFKFRGLAFTHSSRDKARVSLSVKGETRDLDFLDCGLVKVFHVITIEQPSIVIVVDEMNLVIQR